MMKTPQGKYPVFLIEARRDEYLCKLVAKGFQVKRAVVWGHRVEIRFVGDNIGALSEEQADGVLYTVAEIDRRKGR